MSERLYGYGIGLVAGLATIAALWIGYAGWLALLVVLVWAARRHTPANEGRRTHANEYGEHWND